MLARITEIAIHPFRVDEENGWHNTGGEGEEDGWNVHSFGKFNGEDDIFDDEDFTDYDSAWAFALELSERYGVGIDHRY